MVVMPALSFFALLAAAAPVAASDASAQYTSVSWNEKDGLPSPEVLSLTQDHDGYLWVGTTGGLARFDGSRFVVPLGAERFASERINALCLDTDAALWIALEGRVARFADGTTVAYSSEHGLPAGSILTLRCGLDGSVWAGGHGGLSKFTAGRWLQVPVTEGSQPTVESITEDGGAAQWLATSEGAYRRTSHGGAFSVAGPAVPVRNIAQAADGSVWATDPLFGIRRLAPSPADPRRPADDDGGSMNGLRLLSDSRGIFWVGTLGRGLMRFGRAPTLALDRFNAPHHLSGNVVRSLFEDKHGNIWVGTQLGLTRLSEAMIVPAPGGSEARPQVARALLADAAGAIWIGTDTGLIRVASGVTTRYELGDGLPSNVITALHRDARGGIWIGTDRGLATFRDGRVRKVAVPASATPTRISAITTDRAGAIWICDFDKGVFRLTTTGLEHVGRSSHMAQKPASAAFTDSQGRVWIGFRSGLVAVHELGTFTFYSGSDGLAGGMITALLEDARGTMWLGSTRGLSRFDGRTFQTLTHGRELPAGRLTAVQEDDAGNLWLGIDYGLARLTRDEIERAFETGHRVSYDLYDTADGLRGSPNLLGYPNAARAADGTLWFTTAAGAFTVLPGRSRQRNRLSVSVDELVVNGRLVPHSAAFELPAAISQLQFSYSALALRSPQSVRFRYKLEGLDSDWVDNGRVSRVSYASVPPGRYQFRVHASDGGSAAETAMAIVVPPSLHQTAWFRGGAIASGALVVVLAWRSRVTRIRHELSLIEEERARVSREIHDTLLQSLVGTALHLDHMADELEPTQPALSVRLARTRRKLERHIDDAHQAIFELRTHDAPPRDLATSLRDLCAAEDVAPGVAIAFETSGEPIPCPAAAQHHVLRIAGEAIMNAKRHARARHISVGLHYPPTGESLHLRVADDGVGFDVQQPAGEADAHFGLSIIRERAQQIRGTLHVESVPGRGTTVVMSIPLKRAA
jgi:ligand-binding sensor domain-containing protein/signal transduction histidine kinase